MTKQAGNKTHTSKASFFTRLKRDTNRWSVATLTIVCFLIVPILTIGVQLLSGPGESWQHLLENVLADYTINSLYLIVFCAFFSILIGVSCAWIVSRYHFPLRKYLEVLLILPLAIPSYITAYAYAGIVDYGGTLQQLSATFSLEIPKVDVMNIWGLIFVLSLSLYPYVYVATRAFFLYQSNPMLEASKMLGKSETKTFFSILLPLARPAIVGGVLLVLMEVLNDYGAAKYYGVSTFTTGIFRAWFALDEPKTAVYLSALLLVLVFGFLYLEHRQRKNKGYSDTSKSSTVLQRKRLSRTSTILVFLTVLLPVLFGFVFPVVQLLYWASLTYETVWKDGFVWIAMQSFTIAIIAALLTVLFALFLLYCTKWNRILFLKNASKISILGYAIPGAIIAVGVMIPTIYLDKQLVWFAKNTFESSIGFLINGTIIALVYAYMIRFMAVAFSPMEAASTQAKKSIPEASYLLGKKKIPTFVSVEFPLLKKALLSAVLLVFIDIMKELPLTLILKPYDVQTLAVKAFEYASDELIAEAALPSLCIILTGLLPVVFLNKLIVK